MIYIIKEQIIHGVAHFKLWSEDAMWKNGSILNNAQMRHILALLDSVASSLCIEEEGWPSGWALECMQLAQGQRFESHP